MKLRSSILTAALVLGGSSVVAGPAPFACAGEGPDATLVVDTGSAEYKYCVALDAATVSGIHLIELAGQQHGLSYSFGYQGQAVCMLAGVGSEEEECFQGGEPFWGYWQGTASGGWSWSGSGAGSTSVKDGDVEGWSWGTGNDGSGHQQPSATTHASVCGPEKAGGGKAGDGGHRKKERQKERAEAGGSREKDRTTDGAEVGEAGASPTGASLDDDGTESRATKRARKKRGAAKDDNDRVDRSSTPTPPIPYASPSPSVTPSSAPAATSSSGGPPVAGVIGLLLAIGLGFGGAWFLKRRHALSG